MMALYVLKIFGASGRLSGRVDFGAGKDDEAIRAMAYLYRERSCELWCGPRLVTRWDAGDLSRSRRSAPATRRGRPRGGPEDSRPYP